ncbi:MAG: ATP synthase F1 subunit gamma [Paludibacteraceae bacterium]|jgi:F-type H+-transporting ATPase subunit gamma|nr:ATP synthase F1 subunit gamma [Paludibacteraceae bacterium]OQA50562.1 MAG: ATP synthase gamma chain [Bacteroidetes bacterium ADurb.Bin302]
MASLKEIRARINSVSSTRKITSAMKMVSAAKLRKTEDMTLQFLPYKDKLTEVLAQYIGSIEKEELNIPLAQSREIKKVALVAISSNTGLCGTFNTNTARLLNEALSEYKNKGIDIVVYPIGKKIADYAKRLNVEICTDFLHAADKPNYELSSDIAIKLADLFLSGKIDRVELLYNHYKNAGVQIPSREIFLPLSTQTDKNTNTNTLYFVEPDRNTFINDLVPIVVRMRLYATILDSSTAEHGARTTAMQIASENAEKMIGTIKQLYNRARQEVITTELIDIVGGSEALRK